MAARQIDLYDKQRRLAWYLIIPAVLVVVLVIGYPLAQVIVYSFMKYKLDGVTPASFVGLDNYAFVLSDPDWWRAVWNTLIFTFFSVTLETILGLVVALVANAKFKGRTFFRIAILIPWAIPTVVSSQIWKWMFNDVYGVVNLLLTNFHIIPEKIAWLAIPETAIPVIIAVDVWKTVPFMALLILAGLQTIPSDMYEAGAIDGATGVKTFFYLDPSVHHANAACGTHLSDPRCAASVRYLLHHGRRRGRHGDDGDLQSVATDRFPGCGCGFRDLCHHSPIHHGFRGALHAH